MALGFVAGGAATLYLKSGEARAARHAEPLPGPTGAVRERAPVRFAGISGAPGDGDRRIAEELHNLLRSGDVELVPSDTPCSLALTGIVGLDRIPEGDVILIEWTLTDTEGTTVGTVRQQNTVPHGALDADWGENAYYAALGARDALVKLIDTRGVVCH